MSTTKKGATAVGLAWRRGAALLTTRGRRRPICDDVRTWAACNQGADAQVLLEPRQFTRTMPQSVEPEVHDVYARRQVVNQPGRYLVPVRGARLVGARGLVVLPDGSYAAESVWGEPDLAQDPDYLAPRRRTVVSKSGNYFSLVVHWSGTRNYYHWLHDVLIRLHGAMEHLPADTTFIVPARLRPFQQDSLRYLGIPGDRLAPYDGEEVWELETLYFAPRVSNVGSDRGVADQWLRDQILEGADVSPRHGGRRIYISRRNATKRRLVNEEAVETLLVDHGFETVLTEELSLREQAALFAQAEILVSAHGAGLTNILFAAPGLKVVDMIEPGMLDVAFIYWAMADELDHEYWYFVTESVPRPGYQNDTLVPIKKLAATLAAMHLAP
jgi:Glycosyltransferase 61